MVVYEFRFGGYVYDVCPVDEFKDTEAVHKHADEVQRKNNLPYVCIQVRSLG